MKFGSICYEGYKSSKCLGKEDKYPLKLIDEMGELIIEGIKGKINITENILISAQLFSQSTFFGIFC